MGSRDLAGSPKSTSRRHDGHTQSTGDHVSSPFPVPSIIGAIADYLAAQSESQPPQPPTCTNRPPVVNGTSESQASPHRQNSFAGPHLWLPRQQQQHATPEVVTWPCWPPAPTIAPPSPPRTSSPWTAVTPSTTPAAPGRAIHDPDALSGGTTGAAPNGAPGCLHVARLAGCKAAGEGRNFVLSPLSLHAALALACAGAHGETRRELLGFLGSVASLDEVLGELRCFPQTSFACGVWVDRRQALRPEFVEAAGAAYAAVAEFEDFASQAELARQRVNAFVSESTEGRIREVLPPGSVDASTVVVLANALYFKGTWARPFDPWRTFHAPFHLSDGVTVRAPFMTSSFEQHVAVFPGFSALKLPYVFNWHDAAWFYMLILLPDGTDDPKNIADIYDKAVSTPGFIRAHTPAAKVPVGRFMVPKFKFEFEFEASDDMRKLGVNRAFDGGDFSGMVEGGDGLSIRGVYHKATVEVDEVGTVASADTAVSICLSKSPIPPVDFVADRPFLFAVVEEKSGAVLFFGHVVNPLAEG